MIDGREIQIKNNYLNLIENDTRLKSHLEVLFGSSKVILPSTKLILVFDKIF